MSTNTESNKYTILFAVGMVVVVGSFASFYSFVSKTKYKGKRAYGETAKYIIRNGNK